MQGTTAIWKDSSAFVAWATGCTVQRGYMNIANPGLGLASLGADTSALGPAGLNGVISLGDSGIATLTFDKPIFNGPGFDFAIFENGFMTTPPNLAFLELAFVEVSSDGVNFFRFPDTTNIQDTTQMAMAGMDCSYLYNFAGKYVNGYGTPFNLDDLANQPGLDVNHITHVRVIDVVGSVDSLYATYDNVGHKVNDPWPTPFASSGFDLDAVGVIHAVGLNDLKSISIDDLSVYPNPVKTGESVTVKLPVEECYLAITDLNGRVIQQYNVTGESKSLNTEMLTGGMYIVTLTGLNRTTNAKLAVE